MSFKPLLFLLPCLFWLPLYGQDSTLTRLIRVNTTSFQPVDRNFSGPGWTKLTQAISGSQFVLVGEEPHGVAEIPAFVEAVAQILNPKAFIAEISSFEANQLNQLAARPGLPTAYQEQYPFSLSFYSWTEEFRLAQVLHRQRIPVVGIDQVYMGNAGHLLTEMAQLSRNERTKIELRRLAEAYLTNDRQVYQSVGATRLYLGTRLPAAMDSLSTLTAKESVQVQQMARALTTSYAISHSYQTHRLMPTGLSGHQTRVNLMKRNLLEELQSYRDISTRMIPKLLFKFGSNHVGRDRSLNSNVFDIGSLMTNLADAQCQTSLHLFVVGRQGTQNINDSFDRAKNVGPLTPQDNEYLHLFFDQTDSLWQLVDLRPARQALTSHQLLVTDTLLERTLLNYDYLIVIPQVTASGNY